jgi:hypothetical protein
MKSLNKSLPHFTADSSNNRISIHFARAGVLVQIFLFLKKTILEKKFKALPNNLLMNLICPPLSKPEFLLAISES